MLEESPLLAYSSEDESMQSHSLDLVLDGQQKQLTLDDAYLALTPDEHSVDSRPSMLMSCGPRSKLKPHKFSLKYVLDAHFDEATSKFTVAALDTHKILRTIQATVPESSLQAAASFAQDILKGAYREHNGSPTRRRVKVILNPAGGQGKARHVWRQAEKILTAAKCHIDLEATTHARHAVEIGQAINFREYDAVAFVSGDGLPHEYLNGVKSRPDAAEVLEHLPIAQIGAGTSNALACNLTGPQHADDFAEACLSIIKGQPTEIPLCRVQQDSATSYSFLSQAMGLLADCDVGSDAYRWAGRNRVYLAYVACVIAGRSYPCSVELKVVESGSSNIKQDYASRDDARSTELLRKGRKDEGEWKSLPLERVTCFYSGTIPWTDPGLLAFPTARGDGLIDVIISETNSRVDLLTLMDGTEVGKFIDHSSVSHYRVSAYRLTPKKDKTSRPSDLLVIDGERLEYAPIEVSVEGCFFGLSLHGHDRFLPASHWK